MENVSRVELAGEVSRQWEKVDCLRNSQPQRAAAKRANRNVPALVLARGAMFNRAPSGTEAAFAVLLVSTQPLSPRVQRSEVALRTKQIP